MFKVGINHEQPTVVPDGDLAFTTKACCMLANSTSIAEGFSRMNTSMSDFQLISNAIVKFQWKPLPKTTEN